METRKKLYYLTELQKLRVVEWYWIYKTDRTLLPSYDDPLAYIAFKSDAWKWSKQEILNIVALLL